MSGLHPIQWLRRHERAADALLAAFVTLVSVVVHLKNLDVSEEFRSASWWTTLLVIASAVPIAWRRSFPIGSGLFVSAAQIAAAFLDISGASFIGVTIALYSIGAHTAGPRRTRTLWTISGAILVLFCLGLAYRELHVGDFIGSTIILVTAFVLGDNLRQRREKADSLVERAERAEREQALLAQQHVAAERTRIARDLHDVVAHSVSVMVIQAAAARRNLHDAPEVAATALGNIETTGRQTMSELRSILGVLRTETEAGPRAPQPTLADLRSLIESATDLPIDLRAPNDIADIANIADIAPAVSLTAYRVIQESLTNVRRHAGPITVVKISIERTANRLTISVADDGRGAAADEQAPGFGIIGIRERVGALGGTVTAAPASGGGWHVDVSLPTVGATDPLGAPVTPITGVMS